MIQRSLLFILFLVLFGSLIAQEEKLAQLEIIGQPRNLPSEKVAARDGDGYYAAAIQFISDINGFSYDSYNGVIKTEKKPGKDMVFVTAGERVVEVYKQGYEPLKIILSEYDIHLDNRDVWQIKIAGEKKTGNKLPVTFRVIPEGAQLKVDGDLVSTQEPVKLSIGEHKVRAERENYQTLTKTIKVDEKNVFFRLELKEEQDAGLQINSNPPGATVILDGVDLGQTPVSNFYPPGTYPIEVTKKGYVSIEDETLTVETPQTTKHYTLEENVGYLTVKTRPEATVRFNGEEVEANTRIKLNPSVVNVKVTMPKAETLEESVVIKRNDDKTIELMPDIQTGTIQVAPTPFDAKVELTGDAGEHYTAEGMKVFSDIPVGTYQLKVTKEGYQSYESKINLNANDKVTRNPKLEEGPDVDIELVKVEGGCFDMGCTSEQSNCYDVEKPVHEVCVDDFYISKTEVTQKQWREVMGNNPSSFDGCDNCPVESVSWNEVQEFIKKLNQKTNGNYRLPTEAEWEFAARGGNQSQGYEYAGSNTIEEVAWYDDNSDGETHLVSQKQPNELGLYDMSGNVWEWCSDWYDEDYYGDSRRDNPQGPSSGSSRVLRGGSWHYIAYNCRVPLRGWFNPGFAHYSHVGFRIAR